jgi:uncharacterized repeat protein (TIGR02543 family)
MASVLLTSNGIVVMAENVQTAEQESSVIEISSAKDLQKIADNLTGDYVLTKNIDMSDVEFTPIGNNTEPFSGTFDGDGHTISNLNISVKNSGESNFTGLFGVLENATVRNLALENCIITSKTTGGIYAGIIAGKMKNSLLEDIYVSGQIDIKEKTAYSVGGIVGAVFQNVDDETQALKHNVARCIGNVLINVPKNANGENGALVGYAEDTALIENSYSYVLDTKLFGVEIGENNSCKILNESTWNKENSYIGFDFKNVWKITDGGARLCEQTYEKSEGIINSSSDVNEDAEPTEIPKVQKTTDQPNTEADSAKQSKVAGEKASKSISGDNMKTPEQSNDVEGDSDDGIMLLASDLTSGDFTYTVSGNNATITGYTGSSGNLKIPETIDGYKVTGIGGQAFYNQEKIYNVEIPETVTYLGSMMIRGTAVSSITIPKSVSDCGVNNSGSNYYLGPLAGASYLTAVTIEDGMEKIPDYLCSSQSLSSYITSVNIPSSVTSIGNRAFCGCDKLVNAEMPDTVTSIGENVYSQSTKLKSIKLSSTLKTIGGGAFSGCTDLQKVVIPSTVTNLGSNAFNGCTSLTDAEFNYNTQKGYTLEIGGGAFYGCSALENVMLSENVSRIGSETFYGCGALETLILPESVTYLGSMMIRGTAVNSITIPKSVSDCGVNNSGSNYYLGPLAGASYLTTVTIEDGMEKIPDYLCSSQSLSSYITKIVIPESVISIADKSFWKCNNMTIYGYKNSYAESYAIAESIPFVSVAIAKNATADDVLKKMNLNTLVNNISFAGTDISGPTVTIAGKTFSLFSVPASVDVKLGDKVQAKVDNEKKTIQVLIGFDDFSGSAKLDPSENSTVYWSESYKQVKSLYTGVTGNKVDSTKLWNQFSKLRGRLKKMDCSMGINASASAAGYIEFSYASGEITYSSGGVILEANLGTSLDYKLPPCPAVYVTFGVEAGFNGKLSLVRESSMNYTPAMNAGIDLTATLGVGAGSKKIKTYAEVGLKGTLGMDVSLPADSMSEALLVKLTAYAYFDSKVFGFNGPNWGPEEFAGVQLYPRSRERSMALFGGRDLVDFDLNSATSCDRTYLNAPAAQSFETENILYSKDNLYRYNAPQLVNLEDGSMLLLWIDDNGDKTDVNKTSLMYSVYDGTSWSEAKTIAETGGANDYPAVWTDGKKVEIVWQKASKQPENATLPEVLESVELYTATYQDGTLSEARAVTTGNAAYEMMQSVTGNGTDMAVVWMENSENNPFQAEGTNTIKVSKWENGTWKESTVASSVTEVANLNASYVGKDLVITYESTAEDKSSITLIKGEEKKNFEGSSAEISGGILYYCTDDGLMSYDIAGKLTENIISATMGDFTVLDDGKNKMIVATEYTGFASELIAYTFDRSTGTWSDKVTLTDDGKYIRDYSAALDQSGNLTVALNSVEVDEDSDTIYGNATLKVMKFSDTEDITVGKGVYFDNASLISSGKLPLNFSVANNGTKEVSELHVDILDSNDNVLQSGTVSCAIGVGKTEDVSYIYTLPAVITNQVLTIKAYTENETKLTDNTVSVEIGMPDVAIGNMYLSGNSSVAVLKGEIENLGYKNASDVTVTVYDTNEEGNVIGTVSLGTIEKSGTKTFEVSIPAAYLEVNPLVGGNSLYVVASSSSDEMDYANNIDTYLIKSPSDEPLVMNNKEMVLKSDGSGTLEVTYSAVVDVANETVEWTSSDESVVTVVNGKLTAVGTGKATVIARIGDYTAACVVKVDDGIAVAGIYLEETSVSILTGQTKQLTANILPTNATNQKITWESSDKTVATVSADGIVKAVAVGNAEITAYTEDGYKMAICSVTVFHDPDTIYKVTFSGGTNTTGRKPAALSGTAGTIVTLPENSYTKQGYHFIGWTDGENTYEPNTSYRIPYRDIVLTASWEEDEKKEYIISASSQTGGSITPNGDVTVIEGETQKFTITADEGYNIGDVKVDGESVGAVSEYSFENISSNHTIEALFNKATSVKVEKIQLSQTKATLEKGKTLLLDATITPKEAEDKQLKWSSSNIDVASVQNGLVTAIGTGTATITAESQDGSNIKASCIITVTKRSQQFTGTQNYSKKYGDADFNLDAKLTDGDGELGYISSNDAVATVSNAGKVTLKGIGEATITITAAETDDYESAQFKVRIKVSRDNASAPTDKPNDTENPKPTDKPNDTENPKPTDGTNTTKSPSKGTVLKDSKNKVSYKVVTQSKTVTFYKVSNKKATKIVIPATVSLNGIKYKVTAISDNAFNGCKKLKSVTIGKFVTTIGNNVFFKCTALKKITIPSSVTKIGKKAFYGCKKLKSITIKTKKLKSKSVGTQAFKGIYKKAVIKVPKKQKKAYTKWLRKKGITKKMKIK